MEYIVAIEVSSDGEDLQYLANWSGDPGRTAVKESAKKYKTISNATHALACARKYRDFLTAQIRRIN